MARLETCIKKIFFIANNLWWVQDGAGAHRARDVKTKLTEVFGEKVIALGHNVEWPPRSPDLTPCDFSCRDI